MHVDVTDKEQVDALFATAKDTYGSVDIAFNNAGISPPDDDSILDTDLDAWRRVQEVNLTSVYLCCKAALPYMLEQRRGSIINTASFVAVMGAATSQISYSASKGGVLSMTPRARRAVRPRGRAGQRAVPGPGEHPAAQELFAKDPERAARRLVHVPMGRFAEPEEMANAVLFLASDESSASSPPTRSWSTAASPAPTSPRSEPDVPPVIGLTTYREQARVGRVGRAAPTCCTRSTPTRCVAAGGVPVLLPPAPHRRRRAAVVARIDGLVVSRRRGRRPGAVRRASRTRARRAGGRTATPGSWRCSTPPRAPACRCWASAAACS